MKRFAFENSSTFLAATLRHAGRFLNPRSVLSALVLLALCVAGGRAQEREAGNSDAVATDRQTAFRVRSDFNAELNADRGWAGALNEPVTMNVGDPFRIRFELESPVEANDKRQFRLQYRRNGGAWTNVGAERFPKPQKAHELSFEKAEVGDGPEDWRPVQGNTSDMKVVGSEQQPFLRVRTDQEPLLGMGRYETRWEPSQFKAFVRLPDVRQAGASVIFGYVDSENYCRAYLDAAGTIRVSRFVDGEETAITERRASIPSDQWREIEIEVDGEAARVEFGDDEFTADLGTAIPRSAIGFHVPANSTAEFQQFVVEGEPHTPRVSIVDSKTYENEEETTDLLAGSSASYSAGAGVSFDEVTPSMSEGDVQSEWEWPLVIRRFADGAVTNDEGDTFEFRMAYADGHPVASNTNPVITVSVPPRLLGGTFIETPGRIGPWEASNGDLYFLMEPAETYNVLMTVKSTDGGRTWKEVDGADRPAIGDLEGFASDYSDGTIHMLHQTSNEVLHHTFHTSDHPTNPDTWQVRDDTVATPEEPPTQVTSLTVRTDGSIVAVYGGPEKIRYKIRSPNGTWGTKTIIDGEMSTGVLSGPMTVLGKDDVVHLAYTEIGETEGAVWYRRIRPDGTLTPRQRIASGVGTSVGDRGSVLPLIFLPETNTVVVIYRLGTGKLWARRIVDHGRLTDPVQVSNRNVVQSAVDSDQTGADAIAASGAAHVLFIEEGTGSIYHTWSDESGVWTPATLQVDDITGQWIRGRPLRRGSDVPSVYGYVYDAGSNGGSGMNWYGEVPLDDR